MRIVLISPGIDNKYGKGVNEANKHRLVTPMLALPYLASLTPPDIDVKIIDEEHGLMTELETADLVGITGMTMHANRMYDLADQYREKGIPVVLGGIHVSYMPEDAAKHADSIVIGEADQLWPLLIEDFRAGQLKPLYQAQEHPDLQSLPFPKLELVDGPRYQKPYGSLNAIMATRGCPNDCSFCCVTSMFGRKFRMRPIDNVISEIETMNNDPILFADDNLIGNPHYAKELFTALTPLKRKWGGQMSIRIGHDRELLDLASRSGCQAVFIGIESVNSNSLASVNKAKVNDVEKYSEAIKRIHDKGIRIYGSFIVGLDDDDEGVFEQIYNFIVNNKIDYPLVGCLTPFPGTRLFREMEEEKRILDYDWQKYNFTNVVYKPKKMTPEQLQYGYEMLVKSLLRYQMSNSFKASKAIYSF